MKKAHSFIAMLQAVNAVTKDRLSSSSLLSIGSAPYFGAQLRVLVTGPCSARGTFVGGKLHARPLDTSSKVDEPTRLIVDTHQLHGQIAKGYRRFEGTCFNLEEVIRMLRPDVVILSIPVDREAFASNMLELAGACRGNTHLYSDYKNAAQISQADFDSYMETVVEEYEDIVRCGDKHVPIVLYYNSCERGQIDVLTYSINESGTAF